MKDKTIKNNTAKRLRLAARIIGIAVAVFWVLSLVISTIAEYSTPMIWESYVLAGLVTINVAGVIILH